MGGYFKRLFQGGVIGVYKWQQAIQISGDDFPDRGIAILKAPESETNLAYSVNIKRLVQLVQNGNS